MAEKTIEELKADPGTAKAEKILKKAGFSDAWWEGLLVHIAALPTVHARANVETIREVRKRRGELAIKMQELAAKLHEDPRTAEFFPHYGGAKQKEPVLRIGAPHDRALSIGGWLLAYAETLEGDSSTLSTRARFETRRGNSLKAFVIRGVFFWIDFYLESGRHADPQIIKAGQPRMVETALLASALLGKKVTQNDVTQARKEKRRKYELD